MQKTCIKFRISNDEDFGKMLYEDSPVSPEAYDFLKKLWLLFLGFKSLMEWAFKLILLTI